MGLHRILSSWVSNTWSDGESIASLYNLFQCLTMLMEKKKEKKSYHLTRISFAKTWDFCLLSCHCALLRRVWLCPLHTLPTRRLRISRRWPLTLCSPGWRSSDVSASPFPPRAPAPRTDQQSLTRLLPFHQHLSRWEGPKLDTAISFPDLFSPQIKTNKLAWCRKL